MPWRRCRLARPVLLGGLEIVQEGNQPALLLHLHARGLPLRQRRRKRPRSRQRIINQGYLGLAISDPACRLKGQALLHRLAERLKQMSPASCRLHHGATECGSLLKAHCSLPREKPPPQLLPGQLLGINLTSRCRRLCGGRFSPDRLAQRAATTP